MAADIRSKFLLVIIGGVACIFVVGCLAIILWPVSDFKSASSRAAGVSPSNSVQPNDSQTTAVTQNLATPAQESVPAENQVSLTRVPKSKPLLPDEETQKEFAAALNRKFREETQKEFGALFQQLGLSASVQDKVIDILTQQEKQLEEQAFEAIKSGAVPTALSPDELQAQRAQQDQQLRAVLGDTGFAQFGQYRTTIPDRIIINSMNEEGANLSEDQSQQLLQALTEARQQSISQLGVTSSSMSRDQVIATMQQQDFLLQQTVSSRVQNILTAEQMTILQQALSERGVGPKGQ
jgi:hypothetical protein